MNSEVSDLASTNPSVSKKGGKPRVPCLRSLLQTIERLVQSADQNRTTGVHKPCWLAAVDCLGQSAMKKCILHFELVHRPRPRERQRENSAHCSRLHHWTESLIIVHSGMLSEPPKDPTRLVALQSTISTALDCPNPLAGDHIATRQTWHKVPSLVGRKSSVLLFHRTKPVRICQSLTDRRRDRRKPWLPLGGGEPTAEEPRPSAGSPWDGCGEDPDG
jgi:hypothetical protein